MKALSLWQPWASFMMAMPRPPKRNETRPRRINHRGPMAIHATKKEPRWVREAFLEQRSLRDLLLMHLRENYSGHADPGEVFDSLPRGCVLGQVDVIDCFPTESVNGALRVFGADEYALGNYEHGRFIIITKNPRCLVTPVPWRGAQGLWNLPLSALEVP